MPYERKKSSVWFCYTEDFFLPDIQFTLAGSKSRKRGNRVGISCIWNCSAALMLLTGQSADRKLQNFRRVQYFFVKFPLRVACVMGHDSL